MGMFTGGFAAVIGFCCVTLLEVVMARLGDDGDWLYALLVQRGFAQHEAFAICQGPLLMRFEKREEF